MIVSILEVSTNTWVEAVIQEIETKEMPSMHEGWHFNFAKQVSKLKQCSTYALKVSGKNRLEGCMVFQLRPQKEGGHDLPFMPFLEVAPHNFRQNKEYKQVAGCLLAYAYLQSSKMGKDYNKGLLAFEVSEQNPNDEIKLMRLYCEKYHAKRFLDTNLFFIDKEAGKN